MIVLSVISLVISFLLQGLISNFCSYTINNLSLFSTLFVLANFVVLYEYYENNNKFIILLVIFGLLMDIVYNSTALISVFTFIVVFYVNRGLKFFLPYNFVTVNLFAIISLIIYHLITFFFLIILQYDNYTFMVLLKIIGSDLLAMVIYTSILYYVIGLVFKKFELKIVR